MIEISERLRHLCALRAEEVRALDRNDRVRAVLMRRALNMFGYQGASSNAARIEWSIG